VADVNRRGWSALHLREGDRLQCRKGHIHDNVIVCPDGLGQGGILMTMLGPLWGRVG